MMTITLFPCPKCVTDENVVLLTNFGKPVGGLQCLGCKKYTWDFENWNPETRKEIARLTALLAEQGLPTPPGGDVLEVRYVMRNPDWYARTDHGGWYWYDGKEWKSCPYGPSL